ncbi:hypothetical protein FACS1894166_11320 [Bacilli bacterium]|nr:hypothetical protein FACS1894166_11320 [Bacilli bacterium]
MCEFVEFGKESYINKKMHNSSAHVYTLDLLKGLEYGVFSKIDYKKNRITVVKDSAFKHYIDGGRCDDSNDLLTLVGSFNKEIK